ncbi:MAG: hypothetical protein LBI13_02660 [Streptococcaceae bacterium]|jgi:hypothetical protein|nr:hypothetical protein [Streptococcaceae bacterium]
MSEFSAIKDSVKKWVENNLKDFNENGLSVTVEIDNLRAYRVIFQSDLGIAEAAINKPDFAPYRYIDFGIFFDSEKAEIFFYDKKGDTAEYIIESISTKLKKLYN